MNKQIALIALAGLVMMAGCKEKKQTQDIIAPKMEKAKPSAPVRMQTYSDTRDILWLEKGYKVEVKRTPNDSLPLVKDETGQKFVDNSIMVVVRRADGSVAISKTFTKANFDAYVNANYRKAGILEGMVFDKVDGQQLLFAASVSLPQTDEYIPLEVKIDNFGNVKIENATDLDTSGTGEHDGDDEDA